MRLGAVGLQRTSLTCAAPSPLQMSSVLFWQRANWWLELHIVDLPSKVQSVEFSGSEVRLQVASKERQHFYKDHR